MPETHPTLPDPKQFQTLLEGWKALAGFIFRTLTSGLTAIGIPASWAIPVSAVLTGLSFPAGLIVFWLQRRRARERDRVEEIAKASKESDTSAGAAFRGLRRFHRGERLPGDARRLLGNSLLHKVQHPDCRVCVVTGDSGSGKSSLIECSLVEALEEEGYAVVVVADATSLDCSTDCIREESDEIERFWKQIQQEAMRQNRQVDKPVVLILDQFEEFLSSLHSATARSRFAQGLRDALADHWRIVLSLRKEYFPELKEVTNQLTPQISLDDLFLVRNFGRREAEEAILECAGHDGLRIDLDLPAMMVGDLTVDGKVSPTDMQIVCDALHGELTVDRYRRERRATGLRSRFVAEITDLTEFPALARAVLRELCDLPNDRKKTHPVSVAEMVGQIQQTSSDLGASPAAITDILETLDSAHIVVPRRCADGPRWTLIHDYLVEPIKLATEEDVTRTAAAAADLEYFLLRATQRPSTLIPLNRLTQIRRYAPPAAKRQRVAQRLIRKSLLIGYGRPITITAGAMTAAALLALLAATRWDVWQPVGDVVRYGEVDTSVDLPTDPGARARLDWHSVFTEPDQTVILGSGSTVSSYHVSVWNNISGVLAIPAQEGFGSPIPAPGHIWSYDTMYGRLYSLSTHGKRLTRESSVVGPTGSDRVTLERVVETSAGERLVFTPWKPDPRKSGIDAMFNDRPADWRGTEVNAISARWLFAVLDPASGRWGVIVKPAELWPPARTVVSPSPDLANHIEQGQSKCSQLLCTYLYKTSESARLTVWSADLQTKIADASLPARGIELLPIVTTDAATYVMVWDRARRIYTVRITPSLNTGGPVGSNRYDSTPPTITPLPPDLISDALLQPWRSQMGKRLLLVDSDLPGFLTVARSFDPEAQRFDPPLPQDARIADGAVFWSLPDRKSTLLWTADRDGPVELRNLVINPLDQVKFTGDFHRLLLVPTRGDAQLWRLDLESGAAQVLATIDSRNCSQIYFDGEETLVIAREYGNNVFGWTLEGVPLGRLGTIGTDVTWVHYDPRCERVFLWTAESERLIWQRGATIPLYGFRARHRC